MEELQGAMVTGNRPAEVRDPEDLRQGEDWWREYKIDLITIRSLQGWRRFRRKWFAWLDDESLGLHMDLSKLSELQTTLRIYHHGRLYPTEEQRWVLRLLTPQIFFSIEAVRRVSTRDPNHLPRWDEAFFHLASLGYLVLDDDRRIRIDEAKLAPEAGEIIQHPSKGLGPHLEHFLLAVRGESYGTDFTPPDWAQAVESAASRIGKRETPTIYSH